MTPLKRLIVNADDLGADEARNIGIFEAIEAGVVTSASLLPNGPALEDAVRRVRSMIPLPFSLGIHINLSEGSPLSSRLRLLTGQDGCFLGKAAAHRLLLRSGDSDLEDEIRNELKAQCESLLLRDLPIDHLDGHQHVHVFPAVVAAAIEWAERYKLPWLRIPEEPSPSTGMDRVSISLLEEARTFSRIAAEARARILGTSLRAPDRFLGLHLKGRLSLPSLIEVVPEIQPGLTELMVHPGRVAKGTLSAPFSAFSTPDREKELEALLDPRFRQALAENQISLTPYPENRP